MADIRINALATTAASTASDDFIAVDGSANGTRKLNAYSPTFGGNLTVSGTGTSAFSGAIKARSTGADEVGIGPYGTGTGGIYFGNGTVSIFNDANTQLKSLVGLSLAGNLTVSGTGTSTVSGGLNILSNSSATGAVDIGADARASNLRLSLNAAAGNDREIVTYTAGLQRWKIGVTGTAESGSNAGSNWILQAYADNGSTSLGNAISITRSTLATTFGGNLTVSGGTIGTAASTNLTLNGGSSGASLVLGQGANAGGTFTNKGTGFFTFNGPNFSNPDTGGTVLIYSNDSAAIDKGGSLLFGGSYTGTTQTVFAGLAGRKENATAGNYAGYLQFYTGTQASALEEVARLTSTGNFLLGTTIDGGQKLQVAGTAAFTTGTYGVAIQSDSVRANSNAAGAQLTLSGYNADDNQSISLREAGASAINYYSIGGTTSSVGHRFFTGGVKASQTLKVYINDNGLFTTGDATFAKGVLSGVSTGTIGTNTSVDSIAYNASSSGGTKVAIRGTSAELNFEDTGASSGNRVIRFIQDDGVLSLQRINDAFSSVLSTPLSFATNNTATFAGAIAIGNTVNTVSPTSPNRTITMVIGGTTYYIHAKTTND